jgi:hypothetical protein
MVYVCVMLLAWRAGSSGEDGRLSKQEERELKSYITKLHLFEREDIVQESLSTVRKLIGVC